MFRKPLRMLRLIYDDGTQSCRSRHGAAFSGDGASAGSAATFIHEKIFHAETHYIDDAELHAFYTILFSRLRAISRDIYMILSLCRGDDSCVIALAFQLALYMRDITLHISASSHSLLLSSRQATEIEKLCGRKRYFHYIAIMQYFRISLIYFRVT